MKLDVRHFKVDFRKDPETRWDHLLTDSWARRKAGTLCRAVSRQLEATLGPFTVAATTMGARAARYLLRSSQGELDYFEDMEIWSEWTSGDFDQVVLANFSYELHQSWSGLGGGLMKPVRTVGKAVDTVSSALGFAASAIREKFGFCTSVAFNQPRLGMVHCRNVDWPLQQMKSAWGATLLVRWIFEYCSSYDEALRILKKEPAFVPFYVMLVGLKPSNAVVVEVNRYGKNRVYKQPSFPVALGNHYPGETCTDEEMDSEERQELVEERALRCKAKSLFGCFSVVSQFPVKHADTVQSMVLHPQSGTVLLQQT